MIQREVYLPGGYHVVANENPAWLYVPNVAIGYHVKNGAGRVFIEGYCADWEEFDTKVHRTLKQLKLGIIKSANEREAFIDRNQK